MGRGSGPYRPVDLARAAGISTQQVRNDEASGVLPPVQRIPSGQRRYDERHLQALLTYRALLRGFGAPAARAVMRAVRAGDLAAALELVDAGHAELQSQRSALRATRRALEAVADEVLADVRAEDDMLIGQVAEALGVRPSTLRSWDAAGLVSPARTGSRGYRSYSPVDVRDARIAHQMRLAYSRLDQIRDVLCALRDSGDATAIRTVVACREAALTGRSRAMVRAAAALDGYLDGVGRPP
ncbi:MerR family transcriptional regulator [Geodermatophilus sp. TF02-6]|uniref:MerR family transcriptional regulator n=1 Tax=Geodermatophilus sp. TF02-6 TaxID=2250575 RepID=UPI000DE8022A|nr:MerR family transcriptional regulator [Geodermatophilus sp. TF02-6]RBY76433.1 MerR family transcriptional regulator [Geodermatophilus sp. TF02-6]